MDLNKKSLQEGGSGAMIPDMPGMQQDQPAVDPQIKQISDFFMAATQGGRRPEEVIVMLIEKQVEPDIISQALMTAGYQQEDIQMFFKNISDAQRKKISPPTAEEINSNPQELSREEEIQEQDEKLPILDNIDPMEPELSLEAKKGIEIKKENRGKFTKWAKARGMGVQEAARKVMANKDKYPPSIVKMANFARNAAKFKKEEGGEQLPKAQFNIRNLGTEEFAERYGGVDFNNLIDQSLQTNFQRDTKDVFKVRPELSYENRAAMDNLSNAFSTLYTSAVNPNTANPITANPQDEKVDEIIEKYKTDLGNIDYSKFFGPNITGGYVKALDGTTLYEQDEVEKDKKPFVYNPVPDNSMNNLGRLFNFVNNTGNFLFSGRDDDGDGVKDGVLRDFKGKQRLNDLNRAARSSFDFEADISPANQMAIQEYIQSSIANNTPIDPSVFVNIDTSAVPNRKLSGVNDFFTGIKSDVVDFYNNQAKPVLQDVGEGIDQVGQTLINTFNKVTGKQPTENAIKQMEARGYKWDGEKFVIQSKEGGQLKSIPSGKKGKGLRKLPRQVRNKMGYMEYGGPKGEDAYLARRDAAIKASMAKQGDDLPKAQRSIPDRVTNNEELNRDLYDIQSGVQKRVGLGTIYSPYLNYDRSDLFEPKDYQYDWYYDSPKGMLDILFAKARDEELRKEQGLEKDEVGLFKSLLQYPYKDITMPVDMQGPFAGVPRNNTPNTNTKYIKGGDLPKAQFSMPDSEVFDFSTMFSGQTDFMQDTQDVNDSFLQQRFPDLGPTPLEQSNQNLVNALNTQNQAATESNDGSNINPTQIRVNPDKSIKGIATDIYNSNALKSLEGIAAAGVVGASIANDMLFGNPQDEGYVSAVNQTRADKAFEIQSDPFSRGKGMDQFGTFGSEDDATVFLGNTADYGGEKGEAAYLANRDRVIKREMAKRKKGGETVNVSPAMLAKLIAAGADIEML